MSNNQNISVNTAIKSEVKNVMPELIGLFILFIILFSIPIIVGKMLLADSIDSIVLLFLQVPFEGIAVFLTWKVACKISLKNKTLTKYDVSDLLFKMVLWIIFYCTISCFTNIENSLKAFDEYLDNNFSLRYTESLMERIYPEEFMREYQIEKDKKIAEERNSLVIYIIMYSVSLCVVSVIATLLQKKGLKKRILIEEMEV